MSNDIALNWMKTASDTVARHDYTGHMNLISKRVNLLGVPGFESIGYDDWAAQCLHEFDNHIIKSVLYEGLKLRAETDASIMFKTFETVEATDGTINAQGIEVVLEKEDDGVWRLVQERVLPPEETAHDGLIPPSSST